MTDTRIEQTITVGRDDWSTAVDCLAEHLPLSKSKLRDALNKGAVWYHREGQSKPERLRMAKAELRVGDELSIYYDTERLTLGFKQVDVVDDQHDFSVWYKPAGMPMQGDQWSDFHCFERQLEQACQMSRQHWILTPLEADVSGLVLVAHHARMAEQWTSVMKQGQLHGVHELEVQGELPESGELVHTDSGKTRFTRTAYHIDTGVSKANVTSTDVNLIALRTHWANQQCYVLGDTTFDEEQMYRDERKQVLVSFQVDAGVRAYPYQVSLLDE